MRPAQHFFFVNVYNDRGVCLNQAKYMSVAHVSSFQDVTRMLDTKIQKQICSHDNVIEKASDLIKQVSDQHVLKSLQTHTRATRWGHKHPIHMLTSAECFQGIVHLSTGFLTDKDFNIRLSIPVWTTVVKTGDKFVETVAVNVPRKVPLCALAWSGGSKEIDIKQTALSTNQKHVGISIENSHRDTRIQTLEHFKQLTRRLHLNVNTHLKKLSVSDVFVNWSCPLSDTKQITVFYFK